MQCKASYTGAMPLHVFLDSVGMKLPEPERLVITGSAAFDRRSRTITIRECDLVCLRYAACIDISSGSEATAIGPSCSSGGDGPSGSESRRDDGRPGPASGDTTNFPVVRYLGALLLQVPVRA